MRILRGIFKPRFSLRTAFIVGTLLVIPLGWAARERRQSMRELDCIAKLDSAVAFKIDWHDSLGLQESWWNKPLDSLLGPRVLALEIAESDYLGATEGGVLTSLESLEVTGSGSMRPPAKPYQQIPLDLSRLAFAQKLRFLRIDGADLRDLAPLKKLTSLEDLRLLHCPASDLSALAELTGIMELRLLDLPVSDLSPLAGLTKLESLALSKTQVRDLSALAGLQELSELFIPSASVADLRPLTGLKKLEKLEAGGTQIKDLAPLGGLPMLEILSLNDTAISDLGPLYGHKSLKGLAIQGCPGITQQQVEEFQQATPSCKVRH